jgi:hypothetical protein
MANLALGFLGGLVAWIVTTFLAQPFALFLKLRNEAAVAVANYETRPWIGNPESEPPSQEWLVERRKAYDGAGTALVGFSASNKVLARILQKGVFGLFRCNPWSACENLRTLAEAYPGSQSSERLIRSVVRGLRLKFAGLD